MWRITGVILVVVMALGVWPTPVKSQAASLHLLIVGVQTGSTKSASDEVIIIANNSSNPINLQGLSIGYFAARPASLTKPSRTILLQGTMAGNSTFTLATEESSTAADQTFSATLAAAGGSLALMRGTEQLDLVGWGTAQRILGLAAQAPAASQQLVRKQDSRGLYQNTSSNAQDFMVGQEDAAVVPSAPEQSRQLQLSEVLPNPSEPIKDNEGEFIEVWNSGETVLNLKGYVLAVGPSLGKRFTFGDESLEPGAYKAYYITQTKLSLGNGGSRVQLQAPDGTLLSDLSYGEAREGQAWAWDGAAWKWTSTPTPNASNAFTALPEPAASTKAVAKKNQTTKKAAKKAPASSKQGKVKAAKTISASSARQQQAPPVHNGIVAGVGGLAVLYGVYEYRRDLAHFIRKLRSNRKIG